MKSLLTGLLALLLSACLPPVQLPQQELPRQQLPVVAPEVQPKASTLTPGMVVKHIQKGKTTQAEIMEIFGPPDMVTRSGAGEMWGYDKVSRDMAEAATGARVGAIGASGARIGAGGAGLIGGAGAGVLGGVIGLVGGSVGQSATQTQQQTQEQARRTESTTTVFLLVYYNDKGVVTDYRLSATKF
ncbi:MAG: hypothetical protein HY695_35925 [Deltaproteobacteria bacterium]|nr:hypothetical protein [Deltaproteobacteria bacterium]